MRPRSLRRINPSKSTMRSCFTSKKRPEKCCATKWRFEALFAAFLCTAWGTAWVGFSSSKVRRAILSTKCKGIDEKHPAQDSSKLVEQSGPKTFGEQGRMQGIFENFCLSQYVYVPLLDMVRKKKTEEMEGTAVQCSNWGKEKNIYRNFRFHYCYSQLFILD